MPALKELLEAKNWQEMEKIFAENRIAIAAFFAIGLLIIWFTYQQVKQQPEDAPENIDPTIRPRLLEAEATKVKQRLRDSLHNLLMLDLLREEQPQEVGRKPLQTLSLQTLYTVSVNNATSQPQVLDEMVDVLRRSDISGRLLILGQPGGGKTTTLLDLAEELLDKAKQDDKEPMPMIFELSAWRDDSVSILDWLILQLKQEYNLAPGISRVWLERGEILPLLDGLDELGLEKQRKCIQTINQYLAEDKKRDLVVCCREEEYHEGEELLSELHGAVCLQELSDGQIRDYLHQLNRGDLWQSIQSNGEFLELARIPLLLSMMLVAYQGRAIQTKEELFDAYIERRFELLPVGKGEFSRQKIMQFLKFLANRLKGTQTEFLIENMQPNWLQKPRQVLIYKLIVNLIVGLILGLIVGLIVGLILWLILGLIVELIYGLITKESNIEVIEEIQLSLTPKALKTLIKNLLGWLIYGLILGLIYGLILGLITGLIAGLIFGLIDGLKGEIVNKSIPNQGIRNSGKNMVFLIIVFSLIFVLGQIWLKPFLLKLVTAKEVTKIINSSQVLVVFSVVICGGGFACIQHFSLRLVLWYNRYIPWDYAKFLNRASERRFIQQIGGRYRFIHRLLLEHFADMRV
ncbi:MAG: NACHT domain-containing protein [Methylacidiphilales bacterium]|nr:NACHT domain-containing protein [Candidatus Methylacidiphilales bacterium]